MIKRYNVELHESCAWADIEEHLEGYLVKVEDMKTRLEAILWLLNTANLTDVGKVGLEQLIEELK